MARERKIDKGGYMINACMLAYRKHVLGDDSIGWDELGNVLRDALCEFMGDGSFQTWLKSVSERGTNLAQ